MFSGSFSGFNPATFNPASAFGGLGAAAGAGGAAAGLGGAASGLLGLAGGPVGLGLSAVTSILGGIGANKRATAAMQNATNRQWEAATFNLAGDEYQADRSYGRQLQAKRDEDKLRRAGVTGFDDFQNLLNTDKFTTLGASRALSSPLFSGS